VSLSHRWVVFLTSSSRVYTVEGFSEWVSLSEYSFLLIPIHEAHTNVSNTIYTRWLT